MICRLLRAHKIMLSSLFSHARYTFELSRRTQIPEVFLTKILAPTLKNLGECCHSDDSASCFNTKVRSITFFLPAWFYYLYKVHTFINIDIIHNKKIVSHTF